MSFPFAFWKSGAAGAAPTLASLNFSLGDTAGGGQAVVATGTNCASVTSVTIFGNVVAPTSTTATTVTFALPAHASGTGTVSLTGPGGTSGTLSFEYWTPSQATGVDAHLDANKGVTAVATAVGTWVDQSANARSFGQATGANKPTQVAAVFGSLPCIRMTPQQWVRLATKITQAAGRSVFWVGKWTSADAAAADTNNTPLTVVGDSTGGVYTCVGASAATVALQQFSAGPTLYTKGSGLNDGNARLVGWTHDHTSGDAKAYVGATQAGTTAAAIGYQTGFNGYDSIGVGFGDVDGFAGDLGAVVIVNGVISGGDLTKLYAWSQQRFGAV